MSKSNKKKLEQLRKRQIKQRKKMEKIILTGIAVIALIVAAIHYEQTSVNGNNSATSALKKPLSDFTVTLINGQKISSVSLEGQPLVV